MRDRLLSIAIHLDRGLGAAARDLTHRGEGLIALLRSSVHRAPVSDEILGERVRARIGRVVSHPGAIRVSAAGGRITLSGLVLAHEYGALLRAVRSVRGVRGVQDELSVRKSAAGISALQGGHPRQSPAFELMQENWSPGARLLTGLVGGALAVYALRRKGLAGVLAASAGSALLLRSATNVPLKQLTGATGRRAIDIRKTLHVRAPLERVFETLAHYENFPYFMRHVREVRMHEHGRSHWVVDGPAGVPVEWESETTRLEPNRLIAWRTVAGSPIGHAGIIFLEPDELGSGTCLDMQMSYSPPAGAFGHVVAKFFGANPKTELDEDLVRLKSFLETGKRPRDAAAHSSAMPAP
jgi:uncharacterized membrane protein